MNHDKHNAPSAHTPPAANADGLPPLYPPGWLPPPVVDRIAARRAALLDLCRREGSVPTMRRARLLLADAGHAVTLDTVWKDYHALRLQSYAVPPSAEGDEMT